MAVLLRIVAIVLALTSAPTGPFIENFAMAAPTPRPRQQMPLWYEVHFGTEADAGRAVRKMDNTIFEGRSIRVTQDVDRLTMVNVQGINEHMSSEVKWHFSKVAPVVRCHKFEERHFGEVRFTNSAAAWKAKVELDGSNLLGKRLRVELDCSTDSLTKVLVHGLHKAVMWQELKDHFKKAGEIAFAAVHGGLVATVEYEYTNQAVAAMRRLNDSQLRGVGRKLKVSGPWNGTPDTTEVVVRGIDAGVNKRDLMKHFSKVGEIRKLTVENAELPPEFYLPAAPVRSAKGC